MDIIEEINSYTAADRLQKENLKPFMKEGKFDVDTYLENMNNDLNSKLNQYSQFNVLSDFDTTVESPLARTSTPWGQSMFDEDSTYDLEDVQDVRANNQPWFAQLAAGIVKGASQAGTTFLSGTLGLLTGVAEATATQDSSKIFNGTIAQGLEEWNQKMEEWVPNYRTRQEETGPWWENLDTMNFWADGLIKNLGFTVGAMYSGMSFNKLLQGMKILNNGIGAALTGSIYSAFNEGRIEALHTANDKIQYDTALYQDYCYNQMKDYGIDPNNPESMQRALDNGEIINTGTDEKPFWILNNRESLESFDRTMQDINDRANNAGMATLVANTALLSADNLFQFGKIFARGFKPAAKVARANDGSFKKISNSKAIAKGIGNSLTEGFEEMNQGLISETTGRYYGINEDSPESYFRAISDGKAVENANTFAQAITEGFANTYGNGERWQEFMIGAITGALGMPTFGKKSNSSDDVWAGQNKIIGMSGGIAGELTDAWRTNDKVDWLNNFESNIKKHRKHFATSLHFSDIMDGHAADGNAFEYKNAEDNSDFSAIQKYAELGILDEYKNLVKQDFENMLDDDLTFIAETMKSKQSKNKGTSADTEIWSNVDGTLKSETEEGRKEMRKELSSKRDKILKQIEDYQKSIEYVKSQKEVAKANLDETQINELAWLKWKEFRFRDRYKNIKEEILPTLNTITTSLISSRDELNSKISEIQNDYTDNILSSSRKNLEIIDDKINKLNNQIARLQSNINNTFTEENKRQVAKKEVEEAQKEKEELQITRDKLMKDISEKVLTEEESKKLEDLLVDGKEEIKALDNILYTINAIQKSENPIQFNSELLKASPIIKALTEDEGISKVLKEKGGLSSSDFDNIFDKLLDAIRISKLSKDFDTKLEEFIKNPAKLEEQEKKIEREEANKQKNEKKADLKDKIKSEKAGKIASTSSKKDIQDTLELFKDSKKEEDKEVVDKLEMSLEIQNAVANIGSQILNGSASNEVSAAATALVQQTLPKIDNVQELLDLSQVSYKDIETIQGMFPTIDEDSLGQILNNSRSYLNDIFNSLEINLEDFKNNKKAFEELSKKNKKEKKSENNDSASDSGSYVPPVNENSTEENNEDEIEDENNLPDDKDNIETVQNLSKEEKFTRTSFASDTVMKDYWKPTITEYPIHRERGNFTPFVKSLKLDNDTNKYIYHYTEEKNGKTNIYHYEYTYQQYTRMVSVYEYLKDKGAYRNVNNLKEDSKITFFTDIELNKKAEEFVILMKDEEGNTIGDLMPKSNIPVGTQPELEKFLTDAEEIYNTYLQNNPNSNATLLEFKGIKSSVKEMRGWQIPLDIKGKTNTLKEIYGNEKFTLGVITLDDKGEKVFNTSSGITVLDENINLLLLKDIQDIQVGTAYLLFDDKALIPVNNPSYNPKDSSSQLSETVTREIFEFLNIYKTDKQKAAIYLKNIINKWFVTKAVRVNINSGGLVEIKIKGTDNITRIIGKELSPEETVTEVLKYFENSFIKIKLSQLSDSNYIKLIGASATSYIAKGHTSILNKWFTIYPPEEYKKKELTTVPIKTTISTNSSIIEVNYNNTIYTVNLEENIVNDASGQVNNPKPEILAMAIGIKNNIYQNGNPYDTDYGLFDPKTNKFVSKEAETKVDNQEESNTEEPSEGSSNSNEESTKEDPELQDRIDKILKEYDYFKNNETISKMDLKVWEYMFNIVEDYESVLQKIADSKSSDVNELIEIIDNSSLYRRVTEENIDIWDEKTELQWLGKVLPQLNDRDKRRIIKGLIDIPGGSKKAYGSFKNGLITLSEAAAKGTLFHEAFHSVTHTLLEDSEKTLLFEEAKRIYGDNTKVALEEKLAEDFRRYVQFEEYSHPFSKPFIQIFRTLKHLIKSLLGKELFIDKLFYDIQRGKYNSRIQKTDNLSTPLLKEESCTQEMLDIRAKAIANGDIVLKEDGSFDYALAPNGKRSKLYERQWLQVRTKAFKDWFGDWQTLAEQDILMPIGTSGSGKSTWIKSLPNLDDYVIISPDEMRVEFTRDMNNKTKDDEIYQEAAKRAVEAIKQGKKVIFDTTNLKKDRRTAFTDAIYAEIPNAKIAYKLMPLNAELAKQRIKNDIESGKNRANVSPETIDRHAASYPKMLEDIKLEKPTVIETDDISKVIDKNGEPLVVYHGTTSDFTIFSKEKLGSYTNAKSAKLAFFTASNEELSRDIYAQMESDEHFYQRMLKDDPNYTREDLGIGPEEDSITDRIYGEWSDYYSSLKLEYKDVLQELEKHRTTHKQTFSETISIDEEWVTGLELEDYIKEGYIISDTQRKEYEDGKSITISREIDVADELDIIEAAKALNTKRSREFAEKYETLDRELKEALEKAEIEEKQSYRNKVKALFLNIRNPKIDSDYGNSYRAETYSKRIQDAINNSNDGGVIKDTRDPYMTDVYYFFEPNQVKSATDNIGTYSRENDDIRYREVEENSLIEDFLYKEEIRKHHINKYNYSNLSKDAKDYLNKNNISFDVYMQLPQDIKENLIKCIM